jgi:hypothetical protein
MSSLRAEYDAITKLIEMIDAMAVAVESATVSMNRLGHYRMEALEEISLDIGMPRRD